MYSLQQRHSYESRNLLSDDGRSFKTWFFGREWTELKWVEDQHNNFAGTFYDQNLPATLLGGDEIWIQARLFSASDAFWAQFSRSDERLTGDIFQFKATLIPEPSTTLIAVLGVLGTGWMCRRRVKS